MSVPRHLIDINPLLAVIVLALVAAVVLPRLTRPADPVKVKWAQGDIRTAIPAALERYRHDMGEYPSTWQGLKALIQPPLNVPGAAQRWSGPYLPAAERTIDPWGNPYVYVHPGLKNTVGYDLASLGADGRAGRDDIRNWENP